MTDYDKSFDPYAHDYVSAYGRDWEVEAIYDYSSEPFYAVRLPIKDTNEYRRHAEANRPCGFTFVGAECRKKGSHDVHEMLVESYPKAAKFLVTVTPAPEGD